MKTYITTPAFYEQHPLKYDILTDFVHQNDSMTTTSAYIAGTEPKAHVERQLEDCYLEDGDFFMPYAYEITYQGTSKIDDPDEYTPLYEMEPSLTASQIEEMVRKEELEAYDGSSRADEITSTEIF